MQMAAAAEGAVVTTEPEPALPVLRLRGAAPRAAGPRVTWTTDTVEINEYSGKKKSKSAPPSTRVSGPAGVPGADCAPAPPHRVRRPG